MVSPNQLRRFPPFQHLTEQDLQRLASIAEETFTPAGQTVFAEFDPADRLLLVAEGELALEYQLGSGQRRPIDTLTEGELAMWSSLVAPYRSTAYARTVKPTRLIAFDAARLRELCEQDHAFGQRLLKQIARMLAARLESARVQLAAV